MSGDTGADTSSYMSMSRSLGNRQGRLGLGTGGPCLPWGTLPRLLPPGVGQPSLRLVPSLGEPTLRSSTLLLRLRGAILLFCRPFEVLYWYNVFVSLSKSTIGVLAKQAHVKCVEYSLRMAWDWTATWKVIYPETINSNDSHGHDWYISKYGKLGSSLFSEHISSSIQIGLLSLGAFISCIPRDFHPQGAT